LHACQGGIGRHSLAGLGLESEPSSRWGTDLTGSARLTARERGKREREMPGWAMKGIGPRDWAMRKGRKKEKGKEKRGRAGRVREVGRLGWVAWGEK
jgi:hypothetical protein